ncbi:hypothetical protein D6C85_04461 [Aureobasidium pullulans]|uniref:Uncharacterized protein n=1 Tax=Aureobasidium pullulans TaxID=5580 RepID=A0A4S9X287_AURPU|nr:hypothetical protein D6C85_04461 [Aureobasidium pullulans]
MLRRHSIHPQEEEASFTFLSDSGDLSYLPAGHTAVLPHSSIDDNRVPRSIAISTSSTRSLSVPAVASPEEPGTPRRPSCQPSDGLSNEARLGLPEKWFIYPVSRHGGRSSRTPDRKHDDIDFVKFDFTRPLEFCLSADSSSSTDTLPAYRSRTNSSGQLEDTLPPYPVDDKLSSVVQAIYAQNADLLKKPKLKRARPLPRDFTEHELREIRRKTRHRIRVVTRNSLGLTVNLGLSCVAPQMLIAAAINGFCLGIVQKRDVIIAVAEGVAIKLIFLAITLNNDDFLVLTHEMVSAHSETITPMLHELPGFSHAHHAFMLPIEKIQEALGLPTMAQRAVDFGAGGWYDPADVVLKNMFLVGAVQMAMETAIDQVQDRFSRAVENVKEHQAHKRISRLRECQTEGVAWSKNTDFLFKIRHDL